MKKFKIESILISVLLFVLFAFGAWNLYKFYKSQKKVVTVGSETQTGYDTESQRLFNDGQGFIESEYWRSINDVFKDYTERFKNILLAVFKHETGNFKSDNQLRNNNPSGMKVPQQRPNFVNKAKSDNYSHYDSIKDSVKDWLAYATYFNYPKDFATPTEFVEFMKSKKYFEAPITEYAGGVNRWYNS